MTSPIGGISFPTAVTGLAGVTGAPDAVAQAPAAGDNGFASVLVSSLEELQAKQSTSDGLAVQAATGDLRDVRRGRRPGDPGQPGDRVGERDGADGRGHGQPFPSCSAAW